MSFATIMAADLAAIYTTDEFGATAVHRGLDGAKTSCTVIFEPDAAYELPGADDLDVSGALSVRTAQVDTVEVGDTFTIGSDAWEVHHANKATSGLEWLCRVSKQ